MFNIQSSKIKYFKMGGIISKFDVGIFVSEHICGIIVATLKQRERCKEPDVTCVQKHAILFELLLLSFMKAIIHSRYGSADELQFMEVAKPVPKDNEVLIKVFATAVTTGDCNVRNFTFISKIFRPLARIMFGVYKPKNKILGFELTGEIEAAGKDVKRFKVGDQIYGSPGMAFGAHAEYTCVSEDGVIALKPTNISWEEAASVFFGAHTALFFLKKLGNIQVGQKVLVIGASGSIGTYAVQLGKYYGAEVSGVCSTSNLELVKSLGAVKVFDYTKDDYTKNGETYDLIFDTAGNSSFAQCKNSLKSKGIFLASIMNLTEIVQMILTSMRDGKKVKGSVATEKVEDLIFFKELLETGKMKPVIDRIYPLEQTAEAFRYVEKGHKKGSVVITVVNG
jgi:NADPH:quinone reductase-like Zn-dependent oxidoreductase